jgi:spore maturation protein CgeB
MFQLLRDLLFQIFHRYINIKEMETKIDRYIDIIKPQFVALLKKKRYNDIFLEFEDLGNDVIKIYYNNKFIKYLNTQKINLSDIQKRHSTQKWNNFKSTAMNSIIASYTKKKSISIAVIIPVWRNHNILEKCISCLKKQSVKSNILLLVSSKEDINFAVIYGIEYIETPKNPLFKKIIAGYEYVKKKTDYNYIMLAFQSDLFTPNWIKDGCRVMSGNDIVGQDSHFFIDRSSHETYFRTISNQRARTELNSKSDIILDSGKIMKRCLLERIKWSSIKDTLDENDMMLFNTVTKNRLKIGYIQESKFVRVLTECNSNEYYRRLSLSKINNIVKLTSIAKKDRNFIAKLKLRDMDRATMNNVRKVIDISKKKPEPPVNKSVMNDIPRKSISHVPRNDRKVVISDKEQQLKKQGLTYKSRIVSYSKMKVDENMFQSSGVNMFTQIGIEQLYVSNKLGIWRDKLLKSYNLSGYNSVIKSTLFYGVYSNQDFLTIEKHNGNKFILWDGRDIGSLDIHNSMIGSLKQMNNIVHISTSNQVKSKLQKYGISSVKIVMDLNLHDEQFKQLAKLGQHILIFNGFSRDDERDYGKKIYESLMKMLPEYKFIFTNRIKCNYENIFSVYQSCFVGVRIAQCDGVAQFVADLGKMGIPVLHNGEYPNSICWRGVFDMATQIRFLGHCKLNYNVLKKSIISLSEKNNKIKKGTYKLLAIRFPFKENSLYSIKIKNFKGREILIRILCDNREYNLISSNLKESLYLNLNYIDTKNHKQIKYLLIKDNEYNSFSFDQLLITKVTETEAKNEAYDSKILEIEEVKVFKKNHKKKYTAGCIMDTFSYTCFNYELKLVPVRPSDWEDMLGKYNIDFFLFESAWQGTKGAWERQLTSFKIAENGTQTQISLLINHLKKKKIPIIFYNKEDPFNFKIFKELAKEFNGDNDLVVTTDENMIPKYKSLGCKNVIAYPFCCQPIIHNPINKEESDDKHIIFPCSYYAHKYPDRCHQMNKMIDGYTDYIDLYDRQYIFNKETLQIDDFKKYQNWYQFPKKYRGRIKGSLNYKQVLTLYKKYKAVMNTNTVTNSKTMFARRAVEAGASGLPIVSDHALGIDSVFGDTVIYYDDKETVKKLLNDGKFRKGISDRIYKKIMSNYTYKHLIDMIVNNIPLLKKKYPNIKHATKDEKIKDGGVLCIILMDNMVNMGKFIPFMNRYDYFVVSDNLKVPQINTVSYNKLNGIGQKYQYYVIMNEWCEYDKEYVNNMILPTLYTDAVVIGKASFFYRNKNDVVSDHLEHRFTNRLNMNTLVLVNDNKLIKIKELINKDMMVNLRELIKTKFTGTNMYSADRFDFVDTFEEYQSFNNSLIDLVKVGKGINNTVKTNNTNKLIPIIMCTYSRVDLIDKTIKNLKEQSDKNFSLYIWNNMPTDKNRLVSNIKLEDPDFEVFLHNSFDNVGGIGRFYMIRELLKTNDFEYVIFIDDDQEFDEHLVANFRSKAKPKHSFNWYGRKFIKGHPYFSLGAKNKNKVGTKAVAKAVDIGDEFDYGGTGGMIIETSVFKDDELFRSFPEKFKFVEDLWLSCYSQLKHGYKTIKMDQNISQIKDNRDQCTGIWDLKNELLEYCRKIGWGV